MKKIIAFILAMVLLCLCFSGCGKDKLTVGSYVQLGTYLDEPMLWRVYAVAEDTVYLMADRIVTIKAFDAAGDYERGRERATSGANQWEDAALRAWLNAEGEVSYLHAPSKGFVYGGINSYDTEKGFLSAFTSEEEAMLVSMQRKVYLAEKDKEEAMAGTEAIERKTSFADMAALQETAYHTIVNEKISLPDVAELAGMDAALLKAQITDSAKANCKGHGDKETLAYWTLTPNGTSTFAQCVVNAEGELSDAEPRNSCIGVRPVICMAAAGKGLVGEGTEDNPYTMKK